MVVLMVLMVLVVVAVVVVVWRRTGQANQFADRRHIME